MADFTPLNAEAVAMEAARAWAVANAPMASEPARFGESVATVYRSALIGAAGNVDHPSSVLEALAVARRATRRASALSTGAGLADSSSALSYGKTTLGA